MKSRLTIDSGPLIATLYAKDRYHQQALTGFTRLQQEHQQLIVPLPIVFEVYRWLLQRQGVKVAQAILLDMDRGFEIDTINSEDYQTIQAIAQHIPGWSGTLADATVIHVAVKLQCPIWTLDYRDLGRFKMLKFWNP